ncbi:hypothetical protein BD310DRAFT_373207 [Dichomitus squalens]|uniref:Cytochrome P450 n=1 Tax=Dichomitus squalens TaxID=114155 RepID=A0A4Q9PYX8_9APHY|nr:hypothetical protein BD310DRAFT_373207 [Dichomitus squalens]
MPERFLDQEGQLRSDILDPQLLVYGYGRRSCPGRHLAQSSLFITIAFLLHTQDILPRLDQFGAPILPKGNMAHRIVSHPEGLEFRVRVRSRQAETLIQSDCAESV